MLNENEVRVRCLIACDYLARQLRHTAPNHPFTYLWATSLLYTSAEILGWDHLSKIADDMLSEIEGMIFQQNDRCLIVHDGKTQPIWNAMYAHCLFKKGDVDKALAHCDSIALNETTRFHNGTILAVVKHALEITQDDKYNHMGEIAAQIILSAERLSAFDAWGLALWGKGQPHAQKFLFYIARMLETSNVSVEHMIGIVGPTIAQVCNAYRYLSEDDKYESRVEEVLNYQLSLQALPNSTFNVEPGDCGCFVRSHKDLGTRLDYTIASTFMLWQSISPLRCGPNGSFVF